MFGSKSALEKNAKLAALDRAQAVIEFDLAGKILVANENFLSAVGYTLPEIAGRHHSIFVEPGYKDSVEYQGFWDKLRLGQHQVGQFKRVSKSGAEIWIEASYNPLFDSAGKPYRIVKFATDITRQKAEDADRAGQVAAIGKSQGVIAFDLDGTITDANPNFLSVVGYRLDEIAGRHHSMFVDTAYRADPAYAAFWSALKQGTYQAGQYKRLAKGGKEVWIQASYNPILDASGRPYKVVKFATDITEQVGLLAKLRVMIDQNFGEIDQAVGRSTMESRAALEAARNTSGSVGTMAAATEELAASVAEVSESMQKSQAATDSAFERVREASDFTRRLSDAASSMSGIVGLINTIAAQINLLALNATIEAARAGDAGRGFAVVAQEVKSLASQAARATDQINGEIEGIQTVSTEVVGALDSIRHSVDVMRNHVVATAAAVEEQSAVTRDMSVNMQDAARAVATIADNITTITSAVTQVSDAVATTRNAAQVLAR
ncbi:methyl-accepting chemotaxis protein [Methylobacterium brachythecii]|uniref:Methyl-accepting chemotaxis protein n=1 Tax=Methylobacterium brachythecii TaxID=1176177 RepID=A0A7W6AM81_9HYPH|nr:PAS domain-containing methyl-accepting chemotaxis protein [Methylobacterium brachythecii]MBB3904344.1 methyl-accepting chemotaxis protein [Methylobacterium brachythecii]GLS46530.1 signal transduction histidine kinase [Methylobacterium brachythecii]